MNHILWKLPINSTIDIDRNIQKNLQKDQITDNSYESAHLTFF